MPDLDLAVEHLRTTLATARAVEATQTVVNVTGLAAVLAEYDRLRIALDDEHETGRQAEAETTRTAVMGW